MDKVDQYDIEFNENLKLCINEFKNLFGNGVTPICVCAPGTITTIYSYIILEY